MENFKLLKIYRTKMKIGILGKSQSYLPEAFAYKKYLEKYNHEIVITSNHDELINFDTIIMFMGFYPNKRNTNIKYIHEYNSLSLQPYAHIKNKLKQYLNFKPDKRIFLNNYVKFFFNFRDNISFLNRDMGYDISFKDCQKIKNKKIEYDLVYTGSFDNRNGLFECVKYLSKFGFKIALIGNMKNHLYNEFKKIDKVSILGKLDLNEIIKVFNITKCGLNFTPDIFPFNVQSSTKTIEYSAAGLGVISNRYIWAETFEKSRSANFLYLDELSSKDQIYNFNFKNAFVDDLIWENILNESNFKSFIES